MFERGSLWRKWDLHIHTPFSVLNNQFGTDFDNYIKNLFNRAIKNDISVIGITDYFSIEGYDKVLEYRMDISKMEALFEEEIKNDSEYLKKINQINIFPNIELRLDTIITYKDGKNSKVEIHVIFDNTFDSQEIQDNFLNKLNLITDVCLEGTNSTSLTKANLEKLGKKMITEQPDAFGGMGELEAGCNAASVNFKELKEILEKNFKNKYLLLLVEDDITNISWRDQGHMQRKIPYTACHGLMSSNEKTIKWGLEESTLEEFKSYKPCFWGSDAHKYDEMFAPDLDRFCWIKADTTFLGLKQVLINPKERIFIGNVCPQLSNINSNKSNIIEELEITKRSDAKNSDVWFDDKLLLNPHMITIIGNKGSGKSALADIIALICDSKNMEKASFLNNMRFKKLPENYARDYTASIKWKDGVDKSRNYLSDNVDDSAVELVQFLPQKYIEEVCSGLGDEFQEEIEKAIFSYMDNSDKEGCLSLNELINKKTLANKSKFQTLRSELETINIKIYELEKKKRNSYRDSLNEKLKNIQSTLERHLNFKPQKVDKPKEDNNPKAEIINFLDDLISKYSKNYDIESTKLAQINSKLTRINTFKSQADAKILEIEKLNDEYKILQNDLGLKEQQYISIKVNSQNIDEEYQTLVKSKVELDKLLSNTEVELGQIELDESIALNKESINDYINKCNNLYSRLYLSRQLKEKMIKETSLETQRYQKYVKDLEEWETKRKLITGDIDGFEEGSIKKFELEKRYIKEELEKDIEAAYSERRNIIEKIYEIHLANKDILNSIYEPIEKKLEKLLKSMDEKISFDVQILPKMQLKDSIISMVDQRIVGFFHGATEGVANLNELIASTKFNQKQSTLDFVEDIYKYVRKDFDSINKLLKNDELGFYNYIGSLSYLNSQYMLKLGDRDLNELSPGERGIVLLIFYLALNKSDRPLIIDQPEDNLDNQSVYYKLVPCIKEAKRHRQIIIVTHNPNIAIACDSEQIIYCKIDKNTNAITYESGSIENAFIRKYVVDVLEGTMPAFDLRRQKYIN